MLSAINTRIVQPIKETAIDIYEAVAAVALKIYQFFIDEVKPRLEAIYTAIQKGCAYSLVKIYASLTIIDWITPNFLKTFAQSIYVYAHGVLSTMEQTKEISALSEKLKAKEAEIAQLKIQLEFKDQHIATLQNVRTDCLNIQQTEIPLRDALQEQIESLTKQNTNLLQMLDFSQTTVTA